MSLDIIADVDRLQTRIAIMQDGKLLELKYESDEDVVGNIYLAKVTDVVPGLDACFINAGIERNAFLHVCDAMPEEPPRGARRGGRLPRIQDVVKSGDTFLVQVTKGPLETKGARATRHISLPGRYLVLTAQDDKVGVSKKIENEVERRRLRDMAAKLRPEGFGLIVRTRAEDARQEDLEHDVRFLTKVWRSIETKARAAKAPALVHADVSLVFEVVRDILSESADSFVIDDKVTFDQVLSLVDNTAPQLHSRIKLYHEPEPIFARYGVDAELERALRSKVMLPHGGHLNIESTTALTAIDVNSGKFTGASSLEKTVLLTNLDACEEVARQLRLRDIGGIIVIDFIDMDKADHRKQVTTALRNAFAVDRMRTRIMHITRLGLVEMTRKRTGVNLTERLLSPCPCCAGAGKIHSAETVAMRALNDVRLQVAQRPGEAVHVLLDPQSALALVGPQGTEAEALEKDLGVPIYVRATRGIHPESYEIERGLAPAFADAYLPFQLDQIVEIEPYQLLRGNHGNLLALVDGCLLEAPELPATISRPVQLRLTYVTNSFLRGSPGLTGELPGEAGGPKKRRRRRGGAGGRPPVEEVAAEPEFLTMLAETAAELEAEEESVEYATPEELAAAMAAAGEITPEESAAPPSKSRRRGRRGGARRRKPAGEAEPAAPEPEGLIIIDETEAEPEREAQGEEYAAAEEAAPEGAAPSSKSRRRGRRGGARRRKPAAAPAEGAAEEAASALEPPAESPEPAAESPAGETPAPVKSSRRRGRRGGRGRRKPSTGEGTGGESTSSAPPPAPPDWFGEGI
jgi:ribonuclease G